jgi:nucleoid DNA-binding protein
MPGLKYKQEFYNDLAIECGTTDIEEAKKNYHGVVRLVKKRLKTVGFIDLPGLSNIIVFNHKGRKYVNVNSGMSDVVKPHKAIKIKANFTLRKEIREYFKDM